ncbi:hypothetical protein [Lactiplantibacillus pentosus]|uniref:hypothetical protein n=1 Tax=Lactiplantibacillus pentosus TaxID=1589 RepID=UPI001C200AB2|nr:hypothetical protein [Lactiplantibacillus pentosus]MBU7513062.1 hypothetical protein [Lactiplantibacillus pentosus]
MHYILCQPAIQRFKWELEVCLTNLIDSNHVKPADIILLFTSHNNKIPQFFADKYGVEVHVYRDERGDKQYIPSVKPYLWWKFLEEDSSRQYETYFYMDSDVIFREKPNISKLPAKPNCWVASNCNGYLNLDYIRSRKNGEKLLHKMADLIGVTVSSLETINGNSGGAQWPIVQPSVEYWEKVYKDCTPLYSLLQQADSNIQAWTAEMWAQLWNLMYFNIGVLVDHELDFCMATDDVKKYKETKILHNAGVVKSDSDHLFFKGQYVRKTPFKTDLSFVDEHRCSAKYVHAINQVK